MKKRSRRKEWLSQSKECRAEPAEGFQRRFDEASVPTFMTADKVITAKPPTPPLHHPFTKASSGIPLHPPFSSDKTLEVNFSIWGRFEKRAVAAFVTRWADLFSTEMACRGRRVQVRGVRLPRHSRRKGWKQEGQGVEVMLEEQGRNTSKIKSCAIFQSLKFTTCVKQGRWKKTPIMFFTLLQ